MQFTKTPEQLKARRDRVREMEKAGQVMTDAKRKAIKDRQKYLQQLEEKADMILVGLNTNNKPKRQPVSVINTSNEVIGSVRILDREVKEDKLAQQASQIIQEILQ